MAKLAEHPSCLSIRLSTDMTIDLDTGYADLSRARSEFLKTSRLSQISRGYLRSTEITRKGARWNWHDHWIIIPAGSVDAERQRLLEIWDDVCAQLRLTPSSHAQQSATDAAIGYVLKPRLGSGETSLRALLARAARGDADAADDFLEWDSWRRTHPRARFRSSWVAPSSPATPTAPASPRDQRIVTVDDGDLARMGLLSALGVTSKREQADLLGVSESSIARRRRHLPAPRPGLIPFRVSA
jgi:hypothetical protein